jgi:6-phosphogluconolactonase (cycloisomerase 2 family)
MSMDRTGKWLFVTSASRPDMQEFRIDAATGALQPTSQTPSLDSGKPGEIYVTPDNQRLFVALGRGGMDAFPFDADTGTFGTRQHIATLQKGVSTDNALTSDNGSKNLYVGETNAGIRAFAIGADATLQEIAGSPFGPRQTAPTSLIVDPSDNNLFAADAHANTITAYSIAADGALSAGSSASFPSDASPAALTLGDDGKYLLSISKSAVPKLSTLPSK